MRDFVGLDDVDDSTRLALLDFSYVNMGLCRAHVIYCYISAISVVVMSHYYWCIRKP